MENRFRITKQSNTELKSSLAELEQKIDGERRAKDRAVEEMLFIKRQAEEKARRQVQAMDCFLHPAQVAKIKAELRTAEHERQALTAENEALRTSLEMFRQKILEVSSQDRGPMAEVLENILSSTGRSVFQRLYEDAVRRTAHLSNIFDSLRLSPMEQALPLTEQLSRRSSTISNYAHSQHGVWSIDDASPRNGERRSVSCPPVSLDIIHSMHTKNAESLSTMKDETLVPSQGIPEIPEFPNFVRWAKVKSLKTPDWLMRSAAKHLGEFRNEVVMQKVQPGVSASPAPTGPSPTPSGARPSPAPPSAQTLRMVPRSQNTGGPTRPRTMDSTSKERPLSVLSTNDSTQGDLPWEDSCMSVEFSIREPPARRVSGGRHGNSRSTPSKAVFKPARDGMPSPRSQTPDPGSRNPDGGRAFFSRRRQVIDETPRPRSVMA